MCKTPQNDRRPFMAINVLSKIFHNRVKSLATEMGFNESYRHLLFWLTRMDGSTQLALAQAANLKPPTVSITLKKMERDGYVTRVPDECDMRAVHVYLTEKGREFDAASRELVDTIDREAVKDMTDEEIKQFISLLDRVFVNLTGEQPRKRQRSHIKGVDEE